MRLLLLCLLLLRGTAALHILMYLNAIGRSHVQHAEKLIELVNDAGHKVNLVIGVMNRALKLSGNYGAERVLVIDDTELSSFNKALHLNNPLEKRTPWNLLSYSHALHGFLPAFEEMCDAMLQSPEFHSLLRDTKYELVMTTAFESCPNALFHHYNQGPVVSFASTGPTEYQNYYAGNPELPLYDSNFLSSSGFEGAKHSFLKRLVDTLFSLYTRVIHHAHVERMNEKLTAFFGEDFPDVRDILRNKSLDIVNTHPLLEEPRPITFRMRYTGGIGLAQPKPLPKTTFSFLEFDTILNSSRKGTVIFSFGTQVPAARFKPELVQTFLKAFEHFPEYSFLWKFDGSTKFNASNVYNVNWLPQTDLLYDKRVVGFISHMGLNSFLETSFAGVPVVCIPLFADQIGNAKRAVHIGTGVSIAKHEITVDALIDALQKILNEKSYAEKARELAAMMESYPDTARRTLIEGIEYAARFKNLPFHFTPEGAYHSVFVHNGWDIAVFLTLATGLVVSLIVRVSWKLLALLPYKERLIKTKPE